MWVRAHMCRSLWWPEISDLPGAGVLGSWEPPDLVLGTNSVQALSAAAPLQLQNGLWRLLLHFSFVCVFACTCASVWAWMPEDSL